MPTFIVTVRERIDYTVRVEAPDHARAADAAVAICSAPAFGPGALACIGRVVTDRQAIETEEA